MCDRESQSCDVVSLPVINVFIDSRSSYLYGDNLLPWLWHMLQHCVLFPNMSLASVPLI